MNYNIKPNAIASHQKFVTMVKKKVKCNHDLKNTYLLLQIATCYYLELMLSGKNE